MCLHTWYLQKFKKLEGFWANYKKNENHCTWVTTYSKYVKLLASKKKLKEKIIVTGQLIALLIA